jgi:hypothetical protein
MSAWQMEAQEKDKFWKSKEKKQLFRFLKELLELIIFTLIVNLQVPL